MYSVRWAISGLWYTLTERKLEAGCGLRQAVVVTERQDGTNSGFLSPLLQCHAMQSLLAEVKFEVYF